ncbi:protein CNPPD1-like isoform X1 [Pollicipes pollicipes]|uniref:protein CNPPD1-like isoform X1 n=1 Tax=Pollicipes pollicipes TaxID=41117 RepID=UPI0018856E36|nr:protein CNPPD1-like isoform X1 [Pollicipes pollicipes]
MGSSRGGSQSRDMFVRFLKAAASRVFSGRPGRLRSLDVRDVSWISHHACISPAALVMAMVYLERLAVLRPDYLQRTHPKQLFVTSALTASKFLYDDGEREQVFNDEWAASAGLSVTELNAAEIDFLSAMNWELFVSPDCFANMLSRVEAAAALAESSRRGWLTYADLLAVGGVSNLQFTLTLLRDALLKVVAVCSVAYLASVLTLMSSVLLVFHAPAPSSPPPPPPAVFVARPAAEAPRSPGALVGQLCAAAASSSLLLLAGLAPLTDQQPDDQQTAGGDADRPDGRQRLDHPDADGHDAERREPAGEVPIADDRWLMDGLNESWAGLRNPLPDRIPWKPNSADSSQRRALAPATIAHSRWVWNPRNETEPSRITCSWTGTAGWLGLGMGAVAVGS